jgi:D-lactate dehydrogenase (cytochrome)
VTSTPAASNLSSGLVRDLVRALGAGAVLTDPDRLLVYESDGLTRYRQRPLAVLLPADTATCARAVELLHRAGVAVVPRGAGTGLSGGAVPAPGTVVVGTARMNRILDLDVTSRRARVQAGVVNADLRAAARIHGLTYAPDPSSEAACTLGGNVAENSGGPHCLKYGVTSRYVTGLTVVGPDGRVDSFGQAPGLAGGLDLTGLFVGSEGCFGLATEIEVALLPAPGAARTLLAAFGRLEAAGEAVTAILSEGLLPAALEIVDGATIRAVEASVYAAGYPVDAAAVLVVEFDGPEPGLDEELASAAQLCRDAGAREVRTAATDAGRAALWSGRKKAFGAMGRLGPDLMVQDATVPRSRLPEVLRAVDEVATRHGLRVANVFHAGDGNLHPNLVFDRRDPDQVERVERASREIMEVCVQAGGTITGEHGVGLDKRDYMRLVHGPAELDLMDRVRQVFDPRGLFNPGKVLPDPSPPPAPSAGAAEAEPVAIPPTRPTRGAKDLAAVLEAEGIACAAAASGPPVALPDDVEGVRRVLRVAVRHGVQVEVVGTRVREAAGTDAGLRLSTGRLKGVDLHDPADLTVSVGAGTVAGELNRRLAEVGQWCAVDGPGAENRSMGGLTAGGDALALAAAFGGLRDQLLGMTLVTGDGRVLSLGGAVVKNVAGFDLVRLAVGSRGRLGVVTRVVLRTWPRPRAERFLSLPENDARALVPAVGAALGAPLLPASLEVGGGGDGAELLVRMLGSATQVDHATTVLASALGPRCRVLDADEGHDRQARLRPSTLGRSPCFAERPSAAGMALMIERARAASSGRFWALPDQGLLWAEGVEGHGTSEAAGRAAMLEEGLRGVFDPDGVFAGAPVRGKSS